MISRLAVLGDPHGEHERLARVLEWLHGTGVDAIACTGDIADGRGCVNVCCEMLEAAEVISVAGNHDRWLLDDRVRHVANAHSSAELTDSSREFLDALPRQRTLETTLGPAMLCHGVADNDLAKVWPGSSRSAPQRSTELDDLLEQRTHRFLINGHMHFRVLVDFPELLMINGGTLKGERGGVTIIDFEQDAVSAYEVRDCGAPVRVCEHTVSAGSRRIWNDTAAFDATTQPTTLYA